MLDSLFCSCMRLGAGVGIGSSSLSDDSTAAFGGAGGAGTLTGRIFETGARFSAFCGACALEVLRPAVGERGSDKGEGAAALDTAATVGDDIFASPLLLAFR